MLKRAIRTGVAAVAALLTLSASPLPASPGQGRITVDPDRPAGTIRPVHGVNNGPLSQQGLADVSAYYRTLRVPLIRLSDTRFSYYDDVFSLDAVFPNWGANPARPASYDFALSDHYMRPVAALGSDVIFRLGYAVDFDRPQAKRHVTPPDPEKFAAIAEGIARHYNQGWAGGFRGSVRYWEVWNEPDIKPSTEKFAPNLQPVYFWSGTPEQYFRLYEVTARRLKRVDPTAKVGGPALAGDLDFLESFLRYCRDRRVPLDFVSWHLYVQDPRHAVGFAAKVHALLDRYGFGKAESIMDEWNYGPVGPPKYDQTNWARAFTDPAFATHYFETTHNETGAAFAAAMLINMQDMPVDRAAYWDGSSSPRWGLFSPFGVPYRSYHAFAMFASMLETPRRLTVRTDGDGVYALAGRSEDGRSTRALISASRGDEVLALDMAGSGNCRIDRIDRAQATPQSEACTRNADGTIKVKFDGPGVALVTVQ